VMIPTMESLILMEFEDGKFKCDDSDDGKFNFDGIEDGKF
jgi:hypothetical protein